MKTVLCLAVSTVALVAVAASVAAAEPIASPKVKRALVAAGYPAHSRCGLALVPPPPLRFAEREAMATRKVPTCRIVIETRGYSVQVIPYATALLARTAYDRSNNPAATKTRTAAIGNVVLSAYKLPTFEWLRISRLVAATV